MGRPSKYPEEFRREAVELVKSSDRPRVEIARSLGISDSTLSNWVNDGVADVQTGTLRLGGGGISATGSINVGAGATLDISAGRETTR